MRRISPTLFKVHNKWYQLAMVKKWTPDVERHNVAHWSRLKVYNLAHFDMWRSF